LIWVYEVCPSEWVDEEDVDDGDYELDERDVAMLEEAEEL
jgi:hypothetical protein